MLLLTGVKVELENSVWETFRVSCREGLNRKYTMKMKKETPVEVIAFHPRVWKIVRMLSDGDGGRIEVLSETEILVHNSSDWRKKRGCPRIQP